VGDQAGQPDAAPATTRRMRRPERREQILAAATRAFARRGFAATSLDDIAAEAQISRVILYRHFESKTDLYRAVLDRVVARLTETVGTGTYHEGSIAALLRAAAQDPDGFRLLFHYAAREPEFRDFAEQLAQAAVDVTSRHLAGEVADDRWRTWVSHLLPTVVIGAVIAWLDAGRPDPEEAADRIGIAVRGVIEAARPRPARETTDPAE
jgi:AcrR family transcriptional regulator